MIGGPRSLHHAPTVTGDWSVWPATPDDRAALTALLETAPWRHQHLDWFEAQDILGEQPFLLARNGRDLFGCLACTPERREVAWVRLFAAAGGQPVSRLWDLLWKPVEAAVRLSGSSIVAVLATAAWLPSLVERSGFEHLHDVVFLEWPGRTSPPVPGLAVGRLRPMQASDLTAVAEADARAFAPIWQLSARSLAAAFAQADSASVIEADGRPVGYQISTATALGAHLARLAVDPAHQGRGLGTALVADALRSLVRLGYNRVTVNTQSDNGPSLKLYSRLGFRRTGQAYPVYQRVLFASAVNSDSLRPGERETGHAGGS